MSLPLRTALASVASLLLVFSLAAAQGPTPPSAPASPFVLKAVKAGKPPVIDGIVGADEWRGAALATDFIQYEPRRGEPSGVRTEALVLYDAGHLYVAFRAFDAEPITAQFTQRDSDLSRDDAVAIVLDTVSDHRSGYYFVTNALGTQADGRISDDGRTSDGSWDAAWRSAARQTDQGWTAEFDIPLSSLKYAAGDDKTWGINLGRSRRRTLEVSFWSGPLDSLWRVSQAGRLTGLSVPPPADRLQVIPYGLARVETGVAPDWQAGVDVRYAITPTTAVYGTVFPDFATIEADEEEVNLTRFEVSLTEKRQFFLEGQEQFNQRIRTFYSRRIADISVGGKVLGKQGPWAVAFITAQAEPAGATERANYTIGRVQRDVFGRSNVAVTLSNRRFGGLDQGAVSADANLFFTRTFGMTAQVVKSYGRYGSGSEGFYVRPAYDTPTSHVHVRYTHLGNRLSDNLNLVGQVKDDDRREVDSAVEKTVWVRSGLFEQIKYGSNYNVYWSQANTLRSWQVDQSVEVEFRNRFSAEVKWTEEFKRFEKDFRNRQIGMEVGYNTREYQSVSAGVEFGRNFDADFTLWSASARYKVTPQLSAEYSLERLVLNPDPDGESTWIHVLRANQFFTKDLFLRVFVQTNSAIERNNVQAVFVYRYRPPFGTIQVAYQRGTAGFGERSTQGHTFFLKATAVF